MIDITYEIRCDGEHCDDWCKADIEPDVVFPNNFTWVTAENSDKDGAGIHYCPDCAKRIGIEV